SLEPSAVAHTPRLSLDGTAELASWIEQNRRPILDGDNLLRPDMLAGSALIPAADFAWRAPGADAEALAAFNRNSCNGCHGGRSGLPRRCKDDLSTRSRAPFQVRRDDLRPGEERPMKSQPLVLFAAALSLALHGCGSSSGSGNQGGSGGAGGATGGSGGGGSG